MKSKRIKEADYFGNVPIKIEIRSDHSCHIDKQVVKKAWD